MLGGIIPAIVGALFLILSLIVGIALAFGIIIATEYLQKKFKKK